MDAIASRALSVLKACSTLIEARTSMESGVLEILGIAINRYNGLTGRAVSMRPVSQDDRNQMFFMCLDMVLAALNLNIGNISPDYIQNHATIGALATLEIPYTVEASNLIVRISGESQTWGPWRQPVGYFANVGAVHPHGKFHLPVGRRVDVKFVSSTIAQVSMDAGAAGDIHVPLVQAAQNATMVYFVWRRFDVFSDVVGNSVNSPAAMTLTVQNAQMVNGHIVAWNTRDHIRVNNPGNQNGMIEIEVLWYTSLDKTLDQCPNMQSEMFNMYSYKNSLWHGLRAAICAPTTLPNILPPIYPPTARAEVLAVILISKLGDLFDVLRPQFEMFGVVPQAGPITRAIAQAAYQ
ncbi:inner capsid protein [Changuinola virus]|uniref:Core protein VP7 n=2 Tax=Changuinola virus TaxID=40052 RepID=U5YL69_9REOV|nr:inner capsid protein [Changuinola virus]AGY34648.1 inner capsid protein [Changuinola virus]AGZ91962.1 inner capsid protein VP7 [Changuinola virus]AGZ91966.1 inner capsid protein VP7 [Changuinola virus]